MDKLEVYSALSGADYIKDKLLSLLTLGPTQEKLDAYAIKCRIKKSESLIEKISLKQVSNPEYSALTATDIVGLRLISLHSDNLLNMTRVFFDFVRLCQNSGILLFAGSGLKDCVREIKIYKTVNNDTLYYDAIYSEVKLLFQSCDTGKYNTSVSQETASKEQPYSSIHIVCDAVSHIGNETKTIPIEVQIRTVLEDYWAEIDHPIRYKGPDYQKKIDDAFRKKDDHDQYNSLKDDLRTFKTLLDSATAQADGFKTRYEILERNTVPKIKPNRQFAGPTYRFSTASNLENDPEISQDTKHKIHEIETDLNFSYSEMSKLSDGRKAKKEFETLGKIAAKIDIASSDDQILKHSDLQYYLKMELAACFIWRYKLSTAFGLDWYIQTNDIDLAISCYKDLSNSGLFGQNPTIPHKLAFAAFRKDKFYSISFEFLEKAIELYELDENSLFDPFLKIEARKDFAFILWDYYCHQKTNADNYALQIDYYDEDQSLIESILELMDEVIKMEKNKSVFQNDTHKKLETSKSVNNYISYIWEYYNLTGKKYKDKRYINRISIVLEQHFDKRSKNAILYLDSLAKGFFLCGELDKSLKYVEDSLSKLRSAKLGSDVKNRINQEMIEIRKLMEDLS